jgi:hypothetical protein
MPRLLQLPCNTHDSIGDEQTLDALNANLENYEDDSGTIEVVCDLTIATENLGPSDSEVVVARSFGIFAMRIAQRRPRGPSSSRARPRDEAKGRHRRSPQRDARRLHKRF